MLRSADQMITDFNLCLIKCAQEQKKTAEKQSVHCVVMLKHQVIPVRNQPFIICSVSNFPFGLYFVRLHLVASLVSCRFVTFGDSFSFSILCSIALYFVWSYQESRQCIHTAKKALFYFGRLCSCIQTEKFLCN